VEIDVVNNGCLDAVPARMVKSSNVRRPVQAMAVVLLYALCYSSVGLKRVLHSYECLYLLFELCWSVSCSAIGWMLERLVW
jgi:hypothetical protein